MKNSLCAVLAAAVIVFVCAACFCHNTEAAVITLVSNDAAGSYYAENADESEQSGISEIVNVPAEWGSLRAVTSHGTDDFMYFEAADGTVRVVKATVADPGREYMIHAKGEDVTTIMRK